MNILYIGEETRNWVMHLVNELSILGHTITVVVKRYDEYDNDNKVKPLKGVKVVEVENDAYFKPDTVSGLIDDIEQYDVVYGSHIIACTPVKYIGERYNIPWGIQVLDIPIDLMKKEERRIRNWKYYFKALENVTTMTFIIPKARDDWNKYTGQYYDDTHIIHYPIYIPEDYKLSGIDNDDNYIVSFCRVCDYKNISQATESLAQLNTNTKQVVVGKTNNDLDRIMNIASKYGVKAVHTEQVTEKEKFDLIKNASVVVYPQRSEYLGGLSPWEAMFIGTPTLVYDYDLLKGLYKDSAFYANKDKTDSYTHELAYLLTVKKEFIKDKLIKASDYASENNFTNMATKLDKVLRGMIK